MSEAITDPEGFRARVTNTPARPLALQIHVRASRAMRDLTEDRRRRVTARRQHHRLRILHALTDAESQPPQRRPSGGSR